MTESILRLPEVMRRTGLSRASVYKQAKLGRFPRPRKITKRASGWLESEVTAWVNLARVSEGVSAPKDSASH